MVLVRNFTPDGCRNQIAHPDGLSEFCFRHHEYLALTALRMADLPAELIETVALPAV